MWGPAGAECNGLSSSPGALLRKQEKRGENTGVCLQALQPYQHRVVQMPVWENRKMAAWEWQPGGLAAETHLSHLWVKQLQEGGA